MQVLYLIISNIKIEELLEQNEHQPERSDYVSQDSADNSENNDMVVETVEEEEDDDDVTISKNESPTEY